MFRIFVVLSVLFGTFLYANSHYSKAVLEKKIYPMGEKIFKAKCDQTIDPTQYKSLDDLKNNIKKNKLCKKLRGKKLDAVSLYLWDVKSKNIKKVYIPNIKLKEKEKCPVCGMFVYKYPRWVAQIIYQHNDHEHRLSFDGVKDMMKFYFDPNDWGKYPNIDMKQINIVVTDYYTQDPIDGFKAFYVIGSNVYGPMGNELIPFEDYDDAKEFRIDHNGKTIIKFDEITKKGVYKLDE